MDLGCGPMWLRSLIPDSPYMPVDYVSRGPGTIVCDFNKHEFPDDTADVAFVSGCLEYVHDPEWFARKIATHVNRCILSYCTVDYFPDADQRRSFGWQNSLSHECVLSLFAANGFGLLHSEMTPTRNSIYLLERVPPHP